ncbi:MAG: 6-phosphogluconolactonase [candidate division Zixibacteria bacterium]
MVTAGSDILSPVIPLDAEVIERELSKLWQISLQEANNRDRIQKIALSNLIVFCHVDNKNDAENIIQQFDSRTPSRVILIVIEKERKTEPEAHISASCNLTNGMREYLCWEKITIEAGGENLPDIVGLIRSLLIGGEIPVYLVDLYGLKRKVDLRRKIYRLADYIFVDSQNNFELLLPPPGAFARKYIYGFDWTRIDNLREAIRNFFDKPDRLLLLDKLKQISISYEGRPEVLPSTALLLAGWIISSLELDIEILVGNTFQAVEKKGRSLRLRLIPFSEEVSELSIEFDFGTDTEIVSFTGSENKTEVRVGNFKDIFVIEKPFDINQFVFEQSSKDRLRSSYAVSYRAAVRLYNLSRGVSGRRSMIVVDDSNRLSRVSARLFYSLAIRTLAFKDCFYVALSGGSTPRAIYREMVKSPYSRAVAWENVFFFFADERPVGPEHADSNYKLARDFLFEPLGIPDENVFRIEGENPTYKEVCNNYAEIIKAHVPRNQLGKPRFDLIFLGLGEDGHTASLFPELDFDKIDPNLPVIYDYVRKLEQQRFSFNINLVNSAANIFFIAQGENKAAALHSVFFPDESQIVPAARVNPHHGNVLWLIDTAAASRLEGLTVPLEISRW